MQGLGNDFVVIDTINQAVSLTTEQIRLIADRNFGVGCDQLLLLEEPLNAEADFNYRIFNADGYEVAQCGNGARCLARFIRDKKLLNKDEIAVDTYSGRLLLSFDKEGLITVNMGVPKHSPPEIPISAKIESLFYTLPINGTKKTFGAVSIGNPHAIFVVDDIRSAPVSDLGAMLERHAFFPERANIGFMQIINRQSIKLRVYERGAAETHACGSGACAAVVIGIEQNKLDKKIITVELLGGQLSINWQGRGQAVLMQGPAESVFEGKINL